MPWKAYLKLSRRLLDMIERGFGLQLVGAGDADIGAVGITYGSKANTFKMPGAYCQDFLINF